MSAPAEASHPRPALATEEPPGTSMTIQKLPYLDRPPEGWFLLDVMRARSRSWSWVALMVDVDPDELKRCHSQGVALLYVHPDEYRPDPNGRVVREAWLRIPGKFRNKDAAWDALEDMLATRH
jgi:hypothetical protein